MIEIRTSLYVLLTGFMAVLGVTCLLAWQVEQPEPLLFCGTAALSGRLPSARNNPAFERGKELFIANCASCHNQNMHDKLTGPALGGVEERWAAYPRTDLFEFIRNSRKLIKAGHPRAVALWKEYKPTRMNKFTSLSDQDIEDLLIFIDPVRPAILPAKKN